ncbi:MAG: DUF1254 domain-containing protein [Sphingorhabdus sp.]
MRRWLIPVLLGLGIALASYQVTLLAAPYALMHAAMKKIGGRSAENEFAFGQMATASNQPIVRPSPDLSYSTCIFDVSKGPVLVDVAAVPGHYWSVSIFDARTDAVAVRSDRDTGDKPAKLALMRPGQKPPGGYEPVLLRHDRGIVLIRILLGNPEEFGAIDRIRRKSTCRSAETAN